jgi:hypothetical protein
MSPCTKTETVKCTFIKCNIREFSQISEYILILIKCGKDRALCIRAYTGFWANFERISLNI